MKSLNLRTILCVLLYAEFIFQGNIPLKPHIFNPHKMKPMTSLVSVLIYYRSIFVCLSRIWLWCHHCVPDMSNPSSISQLLFGDPNVAPGQSSTSSELWFCPRVSFQLDVRNLQRWHQSQSQTTSRLLHVACFCMFICYMKFHRIEMFSNLLQFHQQRKTCKYSR